MKGICGRGVSGEELRVAKGRGGGRREKNIIVSINTFFSKGLRRSSDLLKPVHTHKLSIYLMW